MPASYIQKKGEAFLATFFSYLSTYAGIVIRPLTFLKPQPSPSSGVSSPMLPIPFLVSNITLAITVRSFLSDNKSLETPSKFPWDLLSLPVEFIRPTLGLTVFTIIVAYFISNKHVQQNLSDVIPIISYPSVVYFPFVIIHRYFGQSFFTWIKDLGVSMFSTQDTPLNISTMLVPCVFLLFIAIWWTCLINIGMSNSSFLKQSTYRWKVIIKSLLVFYLIQFFIFASYNVWDLSKVISNEKKWEKMQSAFLLDPPDCATSFRLSQELINDLAPLYYKHKAELIASTCTLILSLPSSTNSETLNSIVAHLRESRFEDSKDLLRNYIENPSNHLLDENLRGSKKFIIHIASQNLNKADEFFNSPLYMDPPPEKIVVFQPPVPLALFP